MTRYSGKHRRTSTIARDNKVHEAYEEICRKYGKMARLLPRGYIYECIKTKTGLCTKTIAFILNHTIKYKMNDNGDF